MPAVGKQGGERTHADTPLMRQYKTLKAAHPHAILFFRLGDFYELFYEDAQKASPIMGVVLTKRQGTPMCGVPHHSHANYLAKLLKAGYKVAIADQVEDPSQAKGIVQRAVTRVVTPGTIVEDELLQGAATNYLVTLEVDSVGWGLACAEVSTGEFWATQAIGDHNHLQLYSILAKLDPAELLAPQKAVEELRLRHILSPRTVISEWKRTLSESAVPDAWPNRDIWQNRQLALKAALTTRSYLSATQTHLKDILRPRYRESLPEMQLDEAAIRTLELVDSVDGGRKHTLWGVLDRTCTPMGSRKLKHWILHPSTELPEIERRLSCVSELVENSIARGKLRRFLEEIADLERVINRMATRSATPRDLAALRDSLFHIRSLEAWLKDGSFASALASAADGLSEIEKPLKETRALLDRALVDHPPAKLADGGLIRAGVDKTLDELRAVKTDSRKILKRLEDRERGETGIPSLRVGYNSVFGYYIEVTKTHTAKVPDRYLRKQTLTNAERYITSELKELEVKILGAEDKILRIEAGLFEKLRGDVLGHDDAVSRFAALIAELDVLHSLAEAASDNDYVKPEVDLSYELRIEDGRHPIVEAALPSGTFVPNSIALDGADPQAMILTGPNMGGKSVFLRQNALIAIMAQMGSFVPAKSARVGVVDKILTRIGSKDQLARGESTFMVEMRETSHILKDATLRSLVLLDEVGRGTSTYDGISIAWAVIEHLNKAGAAKAEASSTEDFRPRGPRVVFATHYFELTELADLLPGVHNINVEAREWTNAEGRTEVIFLHKISPGPADRSFGIHVAELAGVPQSCLSRARGDPARPRERGARDAAPVLCQAVSGAAEPAALRRASGAPRDPPARPQRPDPPRGPGEALRVEEAAMTASVVRPLPADVARRIAAGEVIERPASVLKELLENALDASASKISVEVLGAGRQLVRVSDDGVGMGPVDCRAAFERHTTSKIARLSDIETLSTFGFRGEALFSIAAVAKVSLTSCRRGTGKGWRVEMRGGRLIAEREAPPAQGTAVEVRDLFFNTPARCKFLKSAASERGRLARVLEEAALANPGVAFTYKSEGRALLRFPAHKGLEGPSAMRERVREVLGDTHGDGMLFAEAGPASGGLSVSAFVSPADALHASRTLQFCLVNRRSVTNRTAQQALYRAYEPFRPKNRHPVAVVCLSIPPDRIDVNVHPTKREVRFRNDGEVFEAVVRALSKALLESKGIPTLKGGHPAVARAAAAPPPHGHWRAGGVGSLPGLRHDFQASGGRVREGTAAYAPTPPSAGAPEHALRTPETRPWFADADSARFLGQIERAYLVFEAEGGLLVIDQHAAQERVLFERYLTEIESGAVSVQKLMLPLPVELPASAIADVLSRKGRLLRAGFAVEPFGKTTLHVTSVPALFRKAKDVREMVHSLLDGLLAPGPAAADVRYDATATIACKAAVKAHDPLTAREAVRLLEDLRRCKDATCCPHGRPTMLSLDRGELARRFGRPAPPPL
ncbi:MAG: DNA mismatch repair protein MutS [Elusimicrobiota bacterium]